MKILRYKIKLFFDRLSLTFGDCNVQVQYVLYCNVCSNFIYKYSIVIIIVSHIIIYLTEAMAFCLNHEGLCVCVCVWVIKLSKVNYLKLILGGWDFNVSCCCKRFQGHLPTFRKPEIVCHNLQCVMQ